MLRLDWVIPDERGESARAGPARPFLDQLVKPPPVEDPQRVSGDQRILELVVAEERGDVDEGPGGAGAGDAVDAGAVARVERCAVRADAVEPTAALAGAADIDWPDWAVFDEGEDVRREQMAGGGSRSAGEDGCVDALLPAEWGWVYAEDTGMNAVEATVARPVAHGAAAEAGVPELLSADKASLPTGDVGDPLVNG